jgi:glycosyltransferase involved in cell wall biosynthesis
VRIILSTYHYFPSRTGGTEIYTRALANHLISQGHEVIIIAGADGRPAVLHNTVMENLAMRIDAYVQDGIQVFTVELKEQTAEDIYSWGNAEWTELFMFFLQAIGWQNTDQLLMNGLTTVSGWSLMDAFLRLNPNGRCMVFVHTPFLCPKGDMIHRKTNSRCMVQVSPDVCGPCMFTEYSNNAYITGSVLYKLTTVLPPVSDRPALRLKKLLKLRFSAMQLINERIDKWVFFSKDMESFLLRQDFALPQKTAMVRHGIDTSIFFQKEKARPGSPITFLYAGRFEAIKGVKLLCDAWLQLKEDAGSRQLYIAGDWKTQRLGVEIEEKLKHRKDVIIMENIPHMQLPELYNQVHCVIIPSLWVETGPLVFHEAIACGCDVITSDRGGQAELGNLYKERSVLFKSGDASSLVSAIENYYPVEKQQQYAVRSVKEHFELLPL